MYQGPRNTGARVGYSPPQTHFFRRLCLFLYACVYRAQTCAKMCAGQRCSALKYARGFYNLLPGVRNLLFTSFNLMHYSAVHNEYFSNCCLPDTSNMEYDSGIRFSVFPSIFKLIFGHKSFEVHYKSEYKTSGKL